MVILQAIMLAIITTILVVIASYLAERIMKYLFNDIKLMHVEIFAIIAFSILFYFMLR